MTAEFLGQEVPENFSDDPDIGFSAMGKPVPFYRQQAAYDACKQMGLANSEQAYHCVSSVSEQLARDQPYEAMKAGMVYLDLIGTYRLMAVLLTAKEP
jgi:hypothetical protein